MTAPTAAPASDVRAETQRDLAFAREWERFLEDNPWDVKPIVLWLVRREIERLSDRLAQLQEQSK